MPQRTAETKIKITDEVLKGAFANQMMVAHNREEFTLDFINSFPPGAIVTARVIITPGHAVRILNALKENIARYEASFGKIDSTYAPPPHKKTDFQA
ncbi:MAG: DUF3467 domain-containing protein [Actinomycetota bacterium]